MTRAVHGGLPRQGPCAARSGRAQLDPAGFGSRLPEREAEVLAPAVEAGAASPRLLDEPVAARPAARQGGLDERGRDVVEADAHAAGHGIAQQLLPLTQHRLAGERLELKRRVRLGHVRGHRERKARAAAGDLLGETRGRAGHAGDAGDIGVGLAGQADHEVQLEAGEAAAEGGAHGLLELRVVDALVDGVAQLLGARLRGERDGPALVGGEAPKASAAESMRRDGRETRTPGRRARMRVSASSTPE